MIYISKSLFFPEKYFVVGYTRTNGNIVNVDDLLSSRLAYAELVSMLGEHPELNTRAFEDGTFFAELSLAHPVKGAQIIENIIECTTGIEGNFSDLIRKLPNRIDNLVMHNAFERIGVLCNQMANKLEKEDYGRQTRMNTPKDKINFSVPTYAELCAVYSIEDKQEPDNSDEEPEEVSETDVQAVSKTYEFIQSDVTPADILIPTYESLNPEINFSNLPVKHAFPFIDSIEFEDALRLLGNPIPVNYVIGNPQNNMLPVQENEKRYYNELISLIKEGLMIENNVVSESEVLELMKMGKRSIIVDKYLTDLAEDAFQINWTHTGTVLSASESTTVEDSSDDDESDGNIDIGVAYPGYYRVDSKDGTMVTSLLINACKSKIDSGTFTQGIDRIRDYCNKQIFNSFAWAEAVIRLLRWGEVKPSCLCIKSYENSKPMYLDLNTLNPTPFAGNVEELVPIYIDEPNNITQYVFGIAHTAKKAFRNQSLINETFSSEITDDTQIPVGIVLRTNYVDQEVYKLDVVDIETFCLMIQTNAIKIKGLSFNKENNSFVVEDVAEDGIEGMIEIDEVLSGNLNNVIVTKIQNPGIVRTLQVISERFKDVRLQEVNTFTIMEEFYRLENMDSMYSAAEMINITSEEARNKALASLKQKTGMTTDRLIKLSLVDKMCTPYLDLLPELDEIHSLESVMNSMMKIKSIKRDTPVRTPQVTLDINPKFTAYINSCIKFMDIVNPVTKEVICYIGALNKGTKEVDGKSVPITFYFFWRPTEFKKQVTATTLELNMFVKTFLAPYSKNKEALENRRFFFATSSTMSEVYNELKKIEEGQ